MAISCLNNRYQIIRTLGRGGFGETFLAVDTHMPSARQCVIKQLKPALETTEMPTWLQERFQREAAILEKLGESHGQIPKLYAYFTEGDNFYLVQEWIEGLTLTQQYDQQGSFSSEAVQRLLLDLLPVLDFIHQRRIIHRDIKPDNIILRARDQKPVLIDFGIIKEVMETVVNPQGKSAYSLAIGTPGYMASEQAAGRPVYSSDLYSLGLTAIFLLTGKTPQYLDQDARTGEILWHQEAPRVSPQLAQVLDRCIRFHPRDRFASAQEMLQALTRPRPEPTAATVVVPQPTRSKPHPTTSRPNLPTASEATESSPWLTWLVMPLLLMGVILGGLSAGFWFANRYRSSTPVVSPPPITPNLESPRPSPQAFPTPWRTPRPSPSPTPSPSPEPSPSLPPLSSPEPVLSPVATPTPLPSVEATPTSEPKATTTPAPLEGPQGSGEPLDPVPPLEPFPVVSPPAPPLQEKPGS
ncbi:protein kinase [Synechocystis sp. LKSZ1]|uniref:protein kinase domain-containing protein n=1 Tax=Synechocystis sp. LKSZ1 TaxID=3144951 RepID=UPI00336BD33E